MSAKRRQPMSDDTPGSEGALPQAMWRSGALRWRRDADGSHPDTIEPLKPGDNVIVPGETLSLASKLLTMGG